MSYLEAARRRTQAFYDWEVRGRGWIVAPGPICPEPVFSPYCPQAFDSEHVEDDGRVPSLAERFTALFTGGRSKRRHARSSDTTEPPEVTPYFADSDLAYLELLPPAQGSFEPEVIQRLLLGLPSEHDPITFEILAYEDRVSVGLVASAPDAHEVRKQVLGHLPGALIRSGEDRLAARWAQLNESGAIVLDFGLGQEFTRPLSTFRRFAPDPLTALYSTLSGLGPGELACLQVQFQRCAGPWAAQAMQALATPDGRPFFADAPEMLPLAREKFATPLFSVRLRLACKAPSCEQALRMVVGVSRGLAPLSRTSSNELIPLEPDDLDRALQEADLLQRQSRRSGMLLSCDELAALVHPPAPGLATEKLPRSLSNTRRAPALGEGVPLGVNEHEGRENPVTLPGGLRSRHVHLIGASGTGKSTLILNMALHDLQAGHGLGVIDPHGDLVDELLARIPEHRLDDLVLVDPADPDYAVGFNVLSARTDLERQLLSSDLVATFKRLATSWGDQMTSVLGNAVLAFLESRKGGTLVDLRRFLVEKEFRVRFLSTVEDPEVLYFWAKEYPLLSGRPQAPILTRLDSFLRHRLIRQMVGQRESSFELRGIMDEGKILLVRLSQGAIGEENAALLGALLVSRLQQAAQSRQELPESERVPFSLYLDEFHNYLTPSMASILAGGRKYRLGLVLAHQDLTQLGRREQGVLGAAISNPATRICFRLGDGDARKLSEGLQHFDANDLQRLGVGEAICRMERSDQDFNVRTPDLPAIEPELARQARERAIASSRELYAKPRSEIRTELASARGGVARVERDKEPAGSESTPVDGAIARQTAKASESVRKSSGSDTGTHSNQAGRGGRQHQYWQRRVKEEAVRRGWKATIEARLPNGLGFVDVLLERGSRRIGVEISVTTSPAQELENLQKCLAAHLELVVGLVCDDATLNALSRDVGDAADAPQRDRVRLGTPESALQLLDSILTEAPREPERSRGYVVTVDGPQRAPDGFDGELASLVKHLWARKG